MTSDIELSQILDNAVQRLILIYKNDGMKMIRYIKSNKYYLVSDINDVGQDYEIVDWNCVIDDREAVRELLSAGTDLWFDTK